MAAQVLYEAGRRLQNLRRSIDYYPEGTLIWLEADVTIRQLSKGAKSLDDFCHAFHGGPGAPPAIKTYNFDDVVAGLNAVQPYDWAGFLNQRLHSTDAHAPLGGIQRSGWKLVYDNVRSDFWKAAKKNARSRDMIYSIGITGARMTGPSATCVRRTGAEGRRRARRQADRGQQPRSTRRPCCARPCRRPPAAGAPRAAGQERRVLRSPPHRIQRRRAVSAPGRAIRRRRTCSRRSSNPGQSEET